MKKIVLLAFVLVLLSTLTSNVQPVKSNCPWTAIIYIRADGSVEPYAAPILTYDNITYTLTCNIVGDVPEWKSAIVVERNNIVLDGAGYTLQGTGTGKGIDLRYRNNVTLRNIEVTNFDHGIYLYYSSNNTLTGNNASNNSEGIYLWRSSNNTLTDNTASSNYVFGIFLVFSSNNTITGNTASSNEDGIYLNSANNNTVTGNNASKNSIGIHLYLSDSNTLTGNIASNSRFDNIAPNSRFGIYLSSSSNNNVTGNTASNNKYGINLYSSSNNTITGNNFINNTKQVYSYNSINVWNNGYPSGGNYWSDYNGTDFYSGLSQNLIGSDGIGDTPYIIDPNNQDNYPLVPPEKMRNFMIEKYKELLSDYQSLNSTYNDLKSKQEATINELNYIRNLMYVFITTTIIFIVATVYLVARKPKIKQN